MNKNIYYIKPNVFYVFKFKDIIKINKTNKNSCNLIVFDNFYENPDEVRNYALHQEFIATGNYPGKRTLIHYGNNEIYNKIKCYLIPLGYNIISFNASNLDDRNGNCAFTISTSKDISKTWIHIDNSNKNSSKNINMSGVLFLTPNAPLNSGTVFYNFDYNSDYDTNNRIEKYSHDITKWKKIDMIGNVYNRLIIFNADIYHSINNLFGTNKYDGRLTQNFFFTCEKIDR